MPASGEKGEACGIFACPCEGDACVQACCRTRMCEHCLLRTLRLCVRSGVARFSARCPFCRRLRRMTAQEVMFLMERGEPAGSVVEVGLHCWRDASCSLSYSPCEPELLWDVVFSP